MNYVLTRPRTCVLSVSPTDFASVSRSRFAAWRRHVIGAVWLFAVAALVLMMTTLSPASECHAALDRIAVVVNNEPIMESELTAAIQDIVRDMRQRKAKIPAERVLVRQTLESIVRERVLLQQALRAGIRLTDADVDKALLNVARRNKLTARQFRDALDREGIDFETYRNTIGDRLLVQRLVDQRVSQEVVVTDDEVDQLVKSEGSSDGAASEYDISRILITVPASSPANDVELLRGRAELVLERIREDFAFEDAAAEFSQAPEALQGGRIGWKKSGQLPALYLGALVGMKKGDVSDLIRGPNGFHILKLNDRRSSNQQIVTQYELRQILMRPNATRSEADVLNRLALLRERLLQGEDFATLASAHTQDPLSQNKGGVVGWVTLEELSEGLRKVVAELKDGEVSEAVRSPFGIHLLSVTGKREHDVTEDIRRNKARQEIYTRKSEQFYEDWVRELRDKAYIEYRIDI